jgi:hypothetical protein
MIFCPTQISKIHIGLAISQVEFNLKDTYVNPEDSCNQLEHI